MGLLERVENGLERGYVKPILALLILASVAPTDLTDPLAPLFFAVFGLEVAVRVVGLARRRARLRLGEVLLVALELLAVASFLPALLVPGQARLLRLARPVRLVLLLRYGAALARDLWTVLTRRERLYQVSFIVVAMALLSLLGALLLEHLQLGIRYGDPSRPDGFLDVLWWTFRQIESGDNLVQTLGGEPALVVVSLTLTLCGVVLFSFIIGVGGGIVDELLRVEAQKPVDQRDHCVVTGRIDQARLLVRELQRLERKNRPPKRRRRIVALGPDEERPAYLYAPEFRKVIYRHGDPAAPEDLRRVNAAHAARSLVLGGWGGEAQDAGTVATVMALRQLRPDTRLYVSLSSPRNLAAVAAAGGERTYAVSTGRVMGLFLCQNLLVDGIERILAELLSAEGSELYTSLLDGPRELEALRRRYPSGEVPFVDLVRWGHRGFGAIPLGVFLGAEPPGLPPERYRPWLNPLLPPDDEALLRLGARAGHVPLAALRGLVAVAPTAGHVERMCRALPDLGPPPPSARLASELAEARPDCARLRRVLVLGANDALAPLCEELARIVPGLELALVVREDAPALRRPRCERGARVVELRAPTLAAPDWEGAPSLAGAPFDAAVLLGDVSRPDPDAETALTLTHFLSAAQRGAVALRAGFELLVEARSEERARLLERQLEGGPRPATLGQATVLSTEQLTNYFLVASAFVPGVVEIYEELLSDRGQEILHLRPRFEHARAATFSALLEAFLPLGMIPIAVDLEGADRPVLNPGPDAPLDLGALRGLHVVTDTSKLAAHLRPARAAEG